jgi:predicted lactoylglutathione lyase
MIAVCKPYDEQPASAGNGSMFGLAAASREQVDAIHAAAIAAGGVCEGEPGMRTDTFYGAYFRDPDGNKICAFKMG